MMGQTQNFLISMAGHNMTLIAVDGADVEPVVVSTFNLHAGERADIVVCANQEPGNYLMSANYDLANFLETAPAPHMPKVDSSKFWGFLNYKGHTDKPGHATKKILGGYNPPAGTGGGLNPPAVAGFVWDTNIQSAWSKVKNLNPVDVSKPDVTYVLDVGITAPSFKPGVTPYSMSDPMYMFTEKKHWSKPASPLLHTKGQCGAENTPFINVPENVSTVEVIINNLSPTAHVLHMHGMRFEVVNYAPFSETWCSNAHFDCFFLPLSVAKAVDCKGARLGDESKDGPGSEYWGCPYDPDTDAKSQILDNPLQKDMISLWRRSWAVIRFKVDNPGVWIFHCHMEQHIPTGQIMAFNLLPSQQPPIPKDVPGEGPCPIWSGRLAPARPPKGPQFFV
jgi:FtsP/CotA-like multicopper oxidase with cupredoxin domain